MATLASSAPLSAARPRLGLVRARAVALPWLLLGTSAWLVGGIYLDGWAHHHDKLDSFFTPWHAVLYSGWAASGGVLLATATPRRAAGRWALELPVGYDLSLAGAALFGLGGFVDMIWHAMFGIEADVAALLSPTHLLLALGATLIVAGPLRAAWLQVGSPSGARGWTPVLASLAFVYAILTFMTQFAQPVVWPEAGSDMTRPTLGSDIYVMASDGSGQTRLTRRHDENAAGAAWSPDGRQLVYVAAAREARAGKLVLADADGSVQAVLVEGGPRFTPFAPTWSPDGQWIAFLAGGQERPDVYLIDVATRGQRQLVAPGLVVGWAGLAWTPDGHHLTVGVVRGDEVWLSLIGVDSAAEPPTPLVEGYDPAWSPDGTRLAFGSERSGRPEIYTVRADGSDPRQLTTTTSRLVRRPGAWRPAWSPDGQRLAFESNRDGRVDVFVMDPDGQHQVNVTDNPSLNSFEPTWLPDGRLSFSARGRGQDGSAGQARGVAGILLHASLLSGLTLLASRRWRLPPGSYTLILGFDGVLLSFQNDLFQFVVSAIIAGVLIDLLAWRLGPLPRSPAGRVRLFAFAVPAVFYSAYFVVLALSQGLGWTVHLWAGSVILAGLVGVLLSYLAVAPAAGTAQA
jgi:Tol biopolymer transport system component